MCGRYDNLIARDAYRGLWIGIERGRAESPKGTDLWALRSDLISVTPLCLDYTSHPTREKFADRLGEIAPLSVKPLGDEVSADLG